MLRAAACALALSGASLAIPGPARAETDAVVDAAIGFLHAQGYRVTEVERTWLGRVRIEAVRGKHERELVLNPRTGEVLRDFIEEDDDGGSNPASATSTNEGAYDDDYGDDDGYDHDYGDGDSHDSSDDGSDNSGSGSGSDNSGSGSDNSGSGSDSSGSGGGGDGGGDDD